MSVIKQTYTVIIARDKIGVGELGAGRRELRSGAQDLDVHDTNPVRVGGYAAHLSIADVATLQAAHVSQLANGTRRRRLVGHARHAPWLAPRRTARWSWA